MTDAHSHLDSCITEVWELLERIGHETTDSPGITRAAWSRNEEMAADRVRTFARRHGLQVLNDAFGNIQFLLPGVDPATPCVTTGSHLDSVPHGGNYDGLAGVAARPCRARCGECRPGQSRQALSGRSHAVRGEPLVRHCVSRKPAHARIVDAGRDRRSRQIRQRKIAATSHPAPGISANGRGRQRLCSIPISSRPFSNCISSKDHSWKRMTFRLASPPRCAAMFAFPTRVASALMAIRPRCRDVSGRTPSLP